MRPCLLKSCRIASGNEKPGPQGTQGDNRGSKERRSKERGERPGQLGDSRAWQAGKNGCTGRQSQLALLQAEQRRQAGAVRGGKDRVCGQMGVRSCPTLTSPPPAYRARGQAGQRRSERPVWQCQGEGHRVTGQKNESSHEEKPASSPGPGSPSTSVGGSAQK